MELAKVTSKGQITIPLEIRKMLNLKEGSKVLFFRKGDEIVIKNSAMLALEEVQEAFDGEAERLGLVSEEDVVELIKKYRQERKNK